MIRIGQSTDIHQLVKGRKLILGGVEIEHEMGLLGHSDADALLHAIAESILGALRQVYKIMEEKGYAIGNLDAMIMIERPKMAPHIPAMRKHVAEALCCDMEQVSIKATRGEKLGFVGREEGVQAQCVVLLHKKEGIA